MSSGYYRLGANVPGKVLKPSNDGNLGTRESDFKLDKRTIKKSDSTPMSAFEPNPRALGYTGDICTNCQSVRVRNNGTCKVCDDCGTTTGCS